MGKTEARKLKTAERRRYVLDMRKSGATYREIAQAAIGEFGLENLPKGWDERICYKDVKRELDRLHRLNALDAHNIRQVELERLNRALFAIWPKVQKGDFGAIDRMLRISERRCKLMGVDAPAWIDLTTGGKPLFDLAEWQQQRQERRQAIEAMSGLDKMQQEPPQEQQQEDGITDS